MSTLPISSGRVHDGIGRLAVGRVAVHFAAIDDHWYDAIGQDCAAAIARCGVAGNTHPAGGETESAAHVVFLARFAASLVAVEDTDTHAAIRVTLSDRSLTSSGVPSPHWIVRAGRLVMLRAALGHVGVVRVTLQRANVGRVWGWRINPTCNLASPEVGHVIAKKHGVLPALDDV